MLTKRIGIMETLKFRVGAMVHYYKLPQGSIPKYNQADKIIGPLPVTPESPYKVSKRLWSDFLALTLQLRDPITETWGASKLGKLPSPVPDGPFKLAINKGLLAIPTVHSNLNAEKS